MIVKTYGIILKNMTGAAWKEACRATLRPSKKPKSRLASMTPTALQRPKMTVARAMKPRPITMPSV